MLTFVEYIIGKLLATTIYKEINICIYEKTAIYNVFRQQARKFALALQMTVHMLCIWKKNMLRQW